MSIASTLSRRSFVAGAAVLAAGTLAARVALAEEAPAAEQASEAAASETPAPAYAVSVYAFNTCDPLGDVCYIVEGTDALWASRCPPSTPPWPPGRPTWRAWASP